MGVGLIQEMQGKFIFFSMNSGADSTFDILRDSGISHRTSFCVFQIK